MRSTLLSLALGLAAVGGLALAPSEASAHGWYDRPVVVVGYPPPAYYYSPPVVYQNYYAAPAYYPTPSAYVTSAAYSAPAYPRYYVAPAYYGGYVGWGRGYVGRAGYYP